MSKSNVYSVSEAILLKWMNFHYNQVNQMQQHSESHSNPVSMIELKSIF